MHVDEHVLKCFIFFLITDLVPSAAIFRSLLYEACGRIINPVHGSVGLMCSGNWTRCQEAVESVLKGSTVIQIPINDDNNTDNQVSLQIMPLKGCDIRHISKNNSTDIHQVVKTRNRFKRKAKVETTASEYMINEPGPLKFSITGWDFDNHMEEEDELKRAPSHDSLSVETVEPSLVNRVEPVLPVKLEEDGDVGLELTLGLTSPA